MIRTQTPDMARVRTEAIALRNAEVAKYFGDAKSAIGRASTMLFVKMQTNARQMALSSDKGLNRTAIAVLLAGIIGALALTGNADAVSVDTLTDPLEAFLAETTYTIAGGSSSSEGHVIDLLTQIAHRAADAEGGTFDPAMVTASANRFANLIHTDPQAMAAINELYAGARSSVEQQNDVTVSALDLLNTIVGTPNGAKFERAFVDSLSGAIQQ